MEMDNKLIAVIMTAVVGIILTGALLAPVVSSLQLTAGDAVTYTNTTSVVLREAESGDVLLLTSEYDTDTSSRTDTWTLNGETITGLSSGAATWDVGVMSDGYYLSIFSASNASSASYVDMDDASATTNYVAGASSGTTTKTYKVTFGADQITATLTAGGDPQSSTYDYPWAYVICPFADGEYCAAVSGGTAIVEKANDVILCGNYTTGDNDTPYYYYDGTGYVANTSYTIDVDIDMALKSGTTDVYNATVTVDISDEEFTPYRILVPYEVEGHKDSGAAYALYGVLPVLLILVLIMGFVYAIRLKNDE